MVTALRRSRSAPKPTKKTLQKPRHGAGAQFRELLRRSGAREPRQSVAGTRTPKQSNGLPGPNQSAKRLAEGTARDCSTNQGQKLEAHTSRATHVVDDGRESKDDDGGGREGEEQSPAAEPLRRVLLQDRVVPVVPPSPVAELPPTLPLQLLEKGLGRWVRRVSWGGDRQQGTARLELGGDLDGAVVLLHADEAGLDVELDLPPEVDAGVWVERLRARLLARGLTIRSLECR